MYDDNGNMVTDETNKDYVYDAWNRLVEVLNSSNVTVAEYGVDGLGRRISETTSGGTRHQYYSNNWQVLEEQDESRTNPTLQQYVWSPVYIDALVLRDRDTGDDTTLDQRLWVAQDANFNVTALYNNSGTVVERHAYSPYGTAAVLNASFTSIGTSAYDWAYRHQGGRWDATSGLVHFRHRDLSTTLGRWMSNDPVQFIGGDSNLYRYVSGSPNNQLDWSGLFAHRANDGPSIFDCGKIGEMIDNLKSSIDAYNSNLREYNGLWLRHYALVAAREFSMHALSHNITLALEAKKNNDLVMWAHYVSIADMHRVRFEAIGDRIRENLDTIKAAESLLLAMYADLAIQADKFQELQSACADCSLQPFWPCNPTLPYLPLPSMPAFPWPIQREIDGIRK